jgi:putative two-component system response regulator
MSEKSKKHRILIVDDEEFNRQLMTDFLSEDYVCETAMDGIDALEKVDKSKPDIIFLDVIMPSMDGFEVCKYLKNNPSTQHIPVVLVTSLSDSGSKIDGFMYGANEFLTKPVDRMELLVRVRNLLKIKEYEDFLVKHNEVLVFQVAEKTKDLMDSYIETIHRLTLAAEYKDDATAAHIRRISYYTKFMAKVLGFPDSRAEIMSYAAPMHDIGKIGTPDHILSKKSGLTPEEFEIIKEHTLIGGKILGGSSSPILKSAEIFALYHHERWCGGGYPYGLKGEAIPIEGRLLNIIDQYDAMRMNRPYKPPFSHELTVNIILEGDGRTLPEHFDPDILDTFKGSHKFFEEIFEIHKD